MYDYRSNIISDIKDYLSENAFTLSDYADRDEAFEALNDSLWIEDSVTGNASGSYYCNAYKAEEAICHNWGLIEDVKNDQGLDLSRGPEYIDVSIRCYLLGECIDAVLDELEEEQEYSEE